MVYLQARPQALNIDPVQTAVSTIDMQNAFFKPAGFRDQLGFDMAGTSAVVGAIRRVATACRDAGVKVAYLQHTYKSKLSHTGGPASPHCHKAPSLRLKREWPDLTTRPTVKVTWGWQIVDELAPEPDDLVVPKRLYSGFRGTTLEMCLRGLEVRWLLF